MVSRAEFEFENSRVIYQNKYENSQNLTKEARHVKNDSGIMSYF